MSANGTEFYVTCIQLNVTGNGNSVPNTTVSFPGAYSPDDAGIQVDVSTYSPLFSVVRTPIDYDYFAHRYTVPRTWTMYSRVGLSRRS